MKADKSKLIEVEMLRANEARTMATMAADAQFWNSAAAELYYTCFYLIQALFRLYELDAHTHAGAKSLFAQHFIKAGLVAERWGKLLSKLLQYRQEGNYGDYGITKEIILPLTLEVDEFTGIVKNLIAKAGYKLNIES